MTKVCHMTSAHASIDVRIFHKECVSLAKAGYETYLVAKGESREDKGVHVIGVGEAPDSRLKRMTSFAKKVYETALSLDCDIYHFHDPELLPYGLKLKKAGKIVVFDSHENVPGQILGKDYLPGFLRKPSASIYKRYETLCVSKFDAVVAATPYIAQQFANRAQKVIDVCNYPRLDDIHFQNTPFDKRKAQICYAGGISDARGEGIMLDAMQGLDAALTIAGDHEMNEEGNVKYTGRLDRTGVNSLYGDSVAGLCLLKPLKNYVDSLPVKLFEYMAAGLPYVCSNFPLWQEITEETGAGFTVDINDIDEVRKKLKILLDDRQLAEQMGRRGREKAEEKYNWSVQEKKLLELYKSFE